MAKVFIPNAERLEALNFKTVAHVPVLFDGSNRYCRAHNWYLRDRAKLDWHPQMAGFGSARKHDYPRTATLLHIAHSLANFIGWLETRQRDWETLSYEGVLEYQQEQIEGRWSSKGQKLRSVTANSRADEATTFLVWAVHRGLRGPFDVRAITKRRHVRSGASARSTSSTVQVRPGRAKVSQSDHLATVVAFDVPPIFLPVIS